MTTSTLAPLAQHELTLSLERERDRLRWRLRLISHAVEPVAELALECALLDCMAEVEAALERIAEDHYGRCENCGESVDIERLYALPWARLCQHCAEFGLDEGIACPPLATEYA